MQTLSLSSPEFLANPYPVYQHLREQNPVFWQPIETHPKGGMWMFTRYSEVEQVLKDLRLSKDSSRTYPQHTGEGRSMLDKDPPDHTRLRSLVNLAFTPKVVEQMRPNVQSITDHLLDRVAGQGELDLIADVALPLPVIVIAELLGVPIEDRERFRDWSHAIIMGMDFANRSPEKMMQAQNAGIELDQYFRTLISERQKEPKDDLISKLIAAKDESGKLSADELLSTCTLLLIAGHETTINLIGNGMLSLLRHPDQFALLRNQPKLIETAVEEMLRYESPVQRATYRAAVEEVEIGGKVIPEGHQVSAVIGAANRDPQQFPNPDLFDIARSPNRHLAFGRGIHFCLGAPLARVEGQIAVSTLLDRFPNLALPDHTPQWRANTLFRGLREFPLKF